MGQAHHMEKERIRGQAQGALPIRPAEELLAFMNKGIRIEDAFPAVANGTSHHAVVAADARGKLREEGFMIDDFTSPLCKECISRLDPLGRDTGNYLLTG